MNQTHLFVVLVFSTGFAQACSPDAESADWRSAKPSQVSLSEIPFSRASQPFFDRSATGIDVLVRAMGSPWTTGDVVVDESLLLGDTFKRVIVRGGPRALTIDTLRSGQVTRFELQSGSEGFCGNSEFLEPGLEVLVTGLGLNSLTTDERRSIEAAWAQSSVTEVKLDRAVIRAASNGCRFNLEFSATEAPGVYYGSVPFLPPLRRN